MRLCGGFLAFAFFGDLWQKALQNKFDFAMCRKQKAEKQKTESGILKHFFIFLFFYFFVMP